ncbi:MAG: shikimate kinase [Spirochaetaceae bacterium]|nr:MAG: shikimate kinase [Spirochaetaceae bacterium]
MADSGYLTLVGLKHVGKSSVARALAADLPDAILADTDEEMVRAARAEGWFLPDRSEESGRDPPIRELYRFLGVQAFSSWETEVLERIITSADRFCIIATGGGVSDNRDALKLLDGARPVVYLHDEPRLLYQRFIRRGIPAFLDQDDPLASFMRLVERRDRVYRELADQVITVSGRSIEQTARDILKLVR